MKKYFLLLTLFFFAIVSVKAQLTNTKWKATIQADETLDLEFQFGKDTLNVINLGEASVIEVYTYTTANSVITLHKVYGQSECDTATTGQYKYAIKEHAISFMIMEDACEQRAAILNNSQWTKVE
ncbi:hypothetical protein FC093_14260 [Ilyomonas limi]|uniref:Uncharacterized protein n=1 Tax=Ilyomonas limi TaxID=2575867 RepID=A0A4U3KXU0_9BACT|nr:hypothetical protein [Ilyomonas limi]TKK67455.1 hypothetical protein FC093_14260 [Ilyomonas limi]